MISKSNSSYIEDGQSARLKTSCLHLNSADNSFQYRYSTNRTSIHLSIQTGVGFTKVLPSVLTIFPQCLWYLVAESPFYATFNLASALLKRMLLHSAPMSFKFARNSSIPTSFSFIRYSSRNHNFSERNLNSSFGNGLQEFNAGPCIASTSLIFHIQYIAPELFLLH